MMTYADADAALISVTAAHAVVTYIDVLHSAEGILVLEIGADRRHPGWMISGNQIWLHPPEEIIHVLTEPVYTVITLPPRTEGWMLFAEGMKHGLLVTALPRKSSGERISVQLGES